MFKRKKKKDTKKDKYLPTEPIEEKVDKINIVEKRDDRDKILLFKLNMETTDYEEIMLTDDSLFHEMLDSSSIFLFLDPKHYKAYLWQGKNTSTREKFVSANRAGSVTRLFSRTMKIITIEEESEVLDFKILMGIEEPPVEEEINQGPIYSASVKHDEIIQTQTHADLILILKRLEIPEGFKREYILVKEKLYKFVNKDDEGIESGDKLLSLKELIPDGTFDISEFKPRLVFSRNEVLFTEFFSIKEEAKDSKLKDYF
jgi:hypothetical protein